MVADAQAELRGTATQVAARLRARGREVSAGTRGEVAPQNEAMRKAIEAMGVAETSLRARAIRASIPLEKEALKHLLRAQAEIRRRQVARQRGKQGSSLSAERAQEDLSALFDRELRRDQSTNYEDRTSVADEQRTDQESETLARLRELAERQKVLNREQQEFAAKHEDVNQINVNRRLERLVREQNEVRQRMEDLRRELVGTGSGKSPGNQNDQQNIGQIAEHMRRAMSELRQGDVTKASETGQQIANLLEELQRRLARRSGRSALGELQLEAQELGRRQRQMAADTRQIGTRSERRDIRARLAAEEDGLADRVDSLEEGIEALLRNAVAPTRQPLTDAVQTLGHGAVAGRMRDLADQLRRVAIQNLTGRRADTLVRIADADDDVAEILERVARSLAAGAEENLNARRLSEDLEKAQALRQQLKQIEERLQQLAQAGGSPLFEGQPPPTLPENGPGGETVQQGGDPLPGSGSRSVPSHVEGRIELGRGLAELQEELVRGLSDSPALLERIRQRRPGLEDELEQWQSRSSPGTEEFKLDYSVWESLRDDVAVALESFEASRSRDLTAEETYERLNIGPADQIPGQYRQLVEQYYKALASGAERP